MTDSGFIGEIEDHPDFREFVFPLDRLDFIRDAVLFIRRDGLIIFSEGYFHPPGQLIGNIVYAPHPDGSKTFFGRRFRSVIKKKTGGEDEWIDYRDQLEIYRELAPESQVGKPLFARYKCLFNLEEMAGFVDHRHSLLQARLKVPAVDDSMNKIARMLAVPVETIGATGSMALGNLESAHDFDLVFYGTTTEHRVLVGRIYRILEDPERRVFEMGMHWAIRFYDDWGNMICPFFSYSDPSEIPLRRFDLALREEEVEFRGRVTDDRHSFYMPSVLELDGVEIQRRREPERLTLILYHGGLRGEYRLHDLVEGRAKLVEVITEHRSFPALLSDHLLDTRKVDK